MTYESYSATNVGKVRKNNEDNYYVNGIFKESTETLEHSTYDLGVKDNNLYAVCDGMGGVEYGEKASMIAVSTLRQYRGVAFSKYVDSYIKSANKKICDLILSNGGTRSGTTFAALSIEKDVARAFNVGDSRVYLIRQGKIMQISVDHTRLKQLMDMGIVTPETAAGRREKHILTRHLGIFPEEMIVSPEISCEIEIMEGDIFLLCSDGLTDMLTDGQILQTVMQNSDVRRCGDALISAALANGGRDNVTVQVIKCTKNKKKISTQTVIIAALVLVMIISALILLKGCGDSVKTRKSSGKTKESSVAASDNEHTENTVFGGILSGGEESDAEKSQDPIDLFGEEEEDDGISIELSMPYVVENGYAERVIAVIHSAYKPKSLIVQIEGGEETVYKKISKKYEKSYEVRDVRIKLGDEYKNGDIVKIKMTVTFTGREDYIYTEKHEIGDVY